VKYTLSKNNYNKPAESDKVAKKAKSTEAENKKAVESTKKSEEKEKK
jgi:hypothetical protein